MMKKTYNFTKTDWGIEDFSYAYGPQTKARKTFNAPEGGALCAGYNEQISDFDYISLISKEKYTANTKVDLRCSFDEHGAPLIVFTDDVSDDGMYGIHFEVVVYEGGVNVWMVEPYPERTERPIRATKLHSESFRIENNTEAELSVRFEEGAISITINGNTSVVKNDLFPRSFRVGFTACEGICRFYYFSIESRVSL